MKEKPLLSIVVPTKDRYYYLKQLILLIKNFNSEEIELVIQDNTTDNAEILEFIADLKYGNLKYFHTKGQIPIYLNADKAIRNSNGEFVCMVGDDDGVTRYIVDACNWMKTNSVECLTCKGFYYRWPDAITAKRFKGTLEVSSWDFTTRILYTKDVLKDLMDKGMINRGDLPLVYHGIVKRSTLDKIWDVCGSFFPGASPDIANGIALSLVTERVAISTIPYAYSGASQHLGGGATKIKDQATTNFKDIPFLPSNIESIWNKRVPKVWAACSIWCESAIEAMEKMERYDLIRKINYEALYEEFVCSFYSYRFYAYQLTENKLSLFLRSSNRIISRYRKKIVRKIKRDLLKIDKDIKIYSDLNNILEANKLIENLIKENVRIQQ